LRALALKTLQDEPPPAKAEDLTLGTPKSNVHQSLPCFSADQSRVGIHVREHRY
jgi:hypothetical protein